MTARNTLSIALTTVALLCVTAGSVPAQCPEEPTLQSFTGSGSVVCPCFGVGEEAGAVFAIPPEHYPIEVLRVGIGWGSLYGGNLPQSEQAINLYNGGLPHPGPRLLSHIGPQLTDGAINEYDLEPLPGEILVASGPVLVTLEFYNANAGDPFAPSMVHDGNGCQPGVNMVKVVPGGWSDACALGVTGDWIVHLVYRQAGCVSDVPQEYVLGVGAGRLHPCYPNPFNPSTTIAYDMAVGADARLEIFNANGRRVATLVEGFVPAGSHQVVWQGRDEAGRTVPSGVYFYRFSGPGFSDTKQMVLLK